MLKLDKSFTLFLLSYRNKHYATMTSNFLDTLHSLTRLVLDVVVALAKM